MILGLAALAGALAVGLVAGVGLGRPGLVRAVVVCPGVDALHGVPAGRRSRVRVVFVGPHVLAMILSRPVRTNTWVVVALVAGGHVDANTLECRSRHVLEPSRESPGRRRAKAPCQKPDKR